MNVPDLIARLVPALRVGERVSIRVASDAGAREVIGFVTGLDAERVDVLDRRGTTHAVARASVAAVRRVGVAPGRDPVSTPRDLLDRLAARAGASGTPWVARISHLLADREPPEVVPDWGEWADVAGRRARFEGEWVTLADAGADTCVAAAWWATRMGARSVQVRTGDPVLAAELSTAGFVRVDAG